MKAYSVLFTNKENPGLPGRRHDGESEVRSGIVIATTVIEAASKAVEWCKANLPDNFYAEEIRLEDDTVIQ